MKKQWCIPTVCTTFVAALEDVLALYAEPDDPKRPKVNFDETRKQLIKEVRTPLPAQGAAPAKYDSVSARNGTANLSCFASPKPVGDLSPSPRAAPSCISRSKCAG